MVPVSGYAAAEFQFLLGRLETYGAKRATATLRRFQFLLGRLETPYSKLLIVGLYLFQFLLGRLETNIPAGESRKPCGRFNSS